MQTIYNSYKYLHRFINTSQIINNQIDNARDYNTKTDRAYDPHHCLHTYQADNHIQSTLSGQEHDSICDIWWWESFSGDNSWH